MDMDGGRWSFFMELRRHGLFYEEKVLEEIRRLERWITVQALEEITLLDSQGWTWTEGDGFFMELLKDKTSVMYWTGNGEYKGPPECGRRGGTKVGESRRADLRCLGATENMCSNLLGWVDAALRLATRDSSYLVLLLEFTNMLWKERNNLIFNGKNAKKPTSVLLRNIYKRWMLSRRPRPEEESLKEDSLAVSVNSVGDASSSSSWREGARSLSRQTDFSSLGSSIADSAEETSGSHPSARSEVYRET
ncbi:hypothetical protein R1sor_005679 [Riccia sorocarpa]|uniref:Uncharacterized protein n=1 Tax=Riccia sorocarpa TaxID=122646 RepID=A0ABD3HK78_9MARC